MFELTFEIPALPKTINAIGRQHWSVKAKEAKKWVSLVSLAVGRHKPKKPLTKAELTLVRYSSKCPDYDGLVSSFKHVVDGLIHCGVISDDAFSVIGVPKFEWISAPKNRGGIRVYVLGALTP